MDVPLVCEARTANFPAVRAYLSRLCETHGVPLRDMNSQLQLPVGHAEGNVSMCFGGARDGGARWRYLLSRS